MSQQQPNPISKSSLLWNVVDPGDPYDIRKSMIARLPEHKENFMGGNLELVCLMQAAEIERLSLYLSQFKVKYEVVERRELDRHYYEVQIKELTEKANEYSKFKTENEKLKEYIKRLTNELEEQRGKSSVSQEFLAKYQDLERRYQTVLVELQTGRDSLQINSLNISKLTEQNLELRMRYDRLDKQRLTEITQQREKYELKIRQKVELQIKQAQHRMDNKIYKLQSDCKLYREQLESKNYEISNLINKYDTIRRELESKDRQISITKKTWQDKTQELEHINENLSKKALELDKIYEQYTRIQTRCRQFQRAYTLCEEQRNSYRQEVERLTISINEVNIERTQQLENKVALLSSEIERLTSVSLTKDNDLRQNAKNLMVAKQDYERRLRQITDEYQAKLRKQAQSQAMQQEINTLRRTNEQLTIRNQQGLRQLSSANRQIRQLEQQLRRLVAAVTAKNQQLQQYESDIQRGKLVSLSIMEAQIRNITEEIHVRARRETEGELAKWTQERALMERTIGEMGQRGRLLQQELAQLQGRFGEREKQHQLAVTTIEARFISQIQELSSDVRVLRGENERLSIDTNKLKQALSESEKEVIMKQNSYYEGVREANRKSSELAAVNEQLRKESSRLRVEITKLQENIQAAQREAQQKTARVFSAQLASQDSIIQSLEAQLRACREEIATQRRDEEGIQGKIDQYRDRLVTVSNEIQRLNELLTRVTAQNQDNELTIQNLRVELQQKDTLYNKQLQLRQQQQHHHFRQEIVSIKTDNQRIGRLLMQKQEQCSRLRAQLEGVQQTYRLQLQQKQSQFSVINNLFRQKQSQLAALKIKLDRIDGLYRQKLAQREGQIGQLNQKIIRVVQQRQVIERQLRSQSQTRIKSVIEQQQQSQSTQVASLTAQIHRYTSELSTQGQAIALREARIRDLETRLLQQQKRLLQLTEHYNQAKLQLQQHGNNKGLWQQRGKQQQIEIINLQKILAELESINMHTTAQRDHLFEISHQYKAELERLKVVAQESGTHIAHITEITSKYNQVNTLCLKYEEKIKAYEVSIHNLSLLNKQYYARIEQMSAQLERLMVRLGDTEASGNAVVELRQQLSRLAVELSNKGEEAREWELKYVQLYQAYSQESESYRAKLREYEQKTPKLEQHFQQISVVIETLRQENLLLRSKQTTDEDLIQKNRQLSAEIDRLTQVQASYKEQLSDTRLRLIDQMALEQRIREHMSLFVILFAEIESLRNRVHQTQEECENVRRSSLTPHRVDRQVGRSVDIPRRQP